MGGDDARCADLAAYQALLAGLPVPRSRLRGDVLRALGEPTEGAPVTLDDELALRVEVNQPGRDEPWEARPDGQEEPDVEFLSVEEFVARKEAQATALVVDSGGATVIPAAGIVLVYGAGGAGKTTLLLDGVVHFASGVAWLDGMLNPCRPLNVGWIENEGPRDEFLRKIERKLARWEHERAGTFRVLNRPWTAFDLRRDGHRTALADEVTRHELDLVVIGPLRSIGMQGGGTPDEVEAFAGLLKQVSARVERPFTFVVIHHDNRAGQVSGAWSPSPTCSCTCSSRGTACSASTGRRRSGVRSCTRRRRRCGGPTAKRSS